MNSIPPHLWNSLSTNLRYFMQLPPSPNLTIPSFILLPFNQLYLAINSSLITRHAYSIFHTPPLNFFTSSLCENYPFNHLSILTNFLPHFWSNVLRSNVFFKFFHSLTDDYLLMVDADPDTMNLFARASGLTASHLTQVRHNISHLNQIRHDIRSPHPGKTWYEITSSK